MRYDRPMVKIADRELQLIKDLALGVFRDTPNFQGRDSKDIQFYCIIAALERFVVSRGGSPGFDIVGFTQEDSFPVDEFDA